MGKIKQKRHALHLSAAKSNDLEHQRLHVAENEWVHSNKSLKYGLSHSLENLSIPPNLFKNVSITTEALKQKLPTYSAKDNFNMKVKSALASSQHEELQKSSGQRYKRKKIPFSEVVSSVLTFLEKKAKEDKKKKKAILGNYEALKDALPDLEQLVKESSVNCQAEKPRVAKRFSKQDAEMMEDMQTYQGVLKDSQYSSDPFGVITSQLKQKLESGLL